MGGIKGFVVGHKLLVLGVVAVLVAVGAFFAGSISSDESDKVADLEDRVASLEADVEDEAAHTSVAESDAEAAEEAAAQAEDELAAERGFKEGGGAQQVASDYDTDYPWEAVGEVGYLAVKPVGWEQSGDKWFLTTEAKNIGKTPALPFCGDGGADVLDAEENEYSGESYLGSGSASCGDELQPGLTATYKTEFELPPNAKPVVVAIYGDWEQEEEYALWDLPR